MLQTMVRMLTQTKEDRTTDVTPTTIKVIDPWEDGKKIQAKGTSDIFCFLIPFRLGCAWEACPESISCRIAVNKALSVCSSDVLPGVRYPKQPVRLGSSEVPQLT